MKGLSVVAVLLFGLTATALAQPSLTLFGVVDTNVRNIRNSGAGSSWSMGTDGISSSRFGLLGVEDLGGGLTASFWLESAFSGDTGVTPARIWHRESYVALSGSFGEVRLGRDYTPAAWNNTDFDPFNATGVGNSKNISNLGNLAPGSIPTYTRADNAIGYFTPENLWGGLYAQAMYSFGENAPGKYLGARVGWASGPLKVAMAYGRTDIDTSGSVRATVFNVGASYEFGFAKLIFQYNRDSNGSIPTPDRDERWLIGFTMPVGPGQLKASYARNNQRGTSAQAANDAQQIAVGYQYNLSRRTAVYANWALLANKGTGVMTIPPRTAPADMTPGGKSQGFEAGIRHRF